MPNNIDNVITYSSELFSLAAEIGTVIGAIENMDFDFNIERNSELKDSYMKNIFLLLPLNKYLKSLPISETKSVLIPELIFDKTTPYTAVIKVNQSKATTPSNADSVTVAISEAYLLRNLWEVFNLLQEFDPYNINSLVKAYEILTRDISLPEAKYRTDVQIFRSKPTKFTGNLSLYPSELPPPEKVQELMESILLTLMKSKEHPLIKSCIFNRQIRYICPFGSYSELMGLIWQTLILCKWKSCLKFMPLGTILFEKQSEYIDILVKQADDNKKKNHMEFTIFMLNALYDSSKLFLDNMSVPNPIKNLISALGKEVLSAKQLMERLEMKHRPTFSTNYIKPALEHGLIEMTVPDKRNNNQQKYKATQKGLELIRY